jgi:hypothetical protein
MTPAATPPAAASPAPANTPIPGLEVVGRGLYLRPYQPYSPAQLLFRQENHRTVYSKETESTYLVPEGYEINESPPFPVNTALNQVTIEESWDRFERSSSMDSNAALKFMPFSISATTSWNNRVRSEQDAYYATRSSFVPLWTVYVPNPTAAPDAVRNPDIPVPFSHTHRAKYDAFFRKYGTHYVTRAWVGGKSTLVFTVLKSSKLAKEDIQEGLQAKYGMPIPIGPQASGNDSTKIDDSREKLRKSSQCTVFGKGGDEVKLAEMSSLDEQSYNNWLETIRDNPQVIELDVMGIWTLVEDPAKAATLIEAYKESVTFDPIHAAFDDHQDVYFIRGSEYVLYNRETRISQPPEPISKTFPTLEKEGFASIDAAFRGVHLIGAQGEPMDRKLFLFRQNHYLRYDLDKRQADPGYPKLISEGWPGMPFERIDTVMMTGPDTIYFFYGNQYARYNALTNTFDKGYPQSISKRWAGVTFDRLDAAVYWGGGQAYFFRGDQHIRYDLANYRSDPGYPKYVVGNYVQDWKFVDD